HERELDATSRLPFGAAEAGRLRRRIEVEVGLLLELGQIALHPLADAGALLAIADLLLDVLERWQDRLAALEHLRDVDPAAGARGRAPGLRLERPGRLLQRGVEVALLHPAQLDDAAHGPGRLPLDHLLDRSARLERLYQLVGLGGRRRR